MIPVLVTTKHRGVFFGYVETQADVQGEIVSLRNARNCIYWSPAVRGFLGLAATGPDQDCRVGPKVKRLDLPGVTAVAEVSSEAVARWENSPWHS